jgi:DNA-directed RNA polymerase specialized sigma24 family protein
VLELHRVFYEQVGKLPPALHRAFVFGWTGECKNYAELAEALSIAERKEVTEDAVKKRIERAFELLEEYLRNEYRY